MTIVGSTDKTPHPFASVRFHVQRLTSFGATSVIGLMIDLFVFSGLLQCGQTALVASRLSSSIAVSFVYFASVRRTFVYRGRFVFGLFAIYAGYQALNVFLTAAAVGGLADIGVSPVVAKLMILPLTFPANYAAMSIITSRRESRRK